MKIVKLTYNYDWPIFRQTPGFSQNWGDYKFVIDENLKECDFWLIYGDYKLTEEKVICNPKNTVFIPGEAYFTSPKYGQKFLDQFALVITVQKELKHKNKVYYQNGLPWFINKTYDELNTSEVPLKSKLISVISSNKITTEGHRKRLDFLNELRKYFGDTLDVFGRGINEIDDKWDVLANYKYSISIENDFCKDYVTEKFFDSLYANTLQFYYGCPNLENYVNKKTFIRIDIDKPKESIRIIEESIKKNEYEKRKNILLKEKIESINRDQLFPLITGFFEKMDSTSKKREINLIANIHSEYLPLKQKIIKVIYKLKIKFNNFIEK